jgi:hypothetical protein
MELDINLMRLFCFLQSRLKMPAALFLWSGLVALMVHGKTIHAVWLNVARKRSTAPSCVSGSRAGVPYKNWNRMCLSDLCISESFVVFGKISYHQTFSDTILT